jgi:SpoVK/Ycf46/Vps4 family AAA+-type ATPase
MPTNTRPIRKAKSNTPLSRPSQRAVTSRRTDRASGRARSIANGGGRGTRILVTGPTAAERQRLAAEVATQLGRRIVRVDLSQIRNGYIGETEKNLGKTFDSAERANAILILDEADALFGRRTSVKDANDRYANQEIGYLLYRLEQSPVVVVLAMNSTAKIDPKFQRQLRLSIKLTRPEESAAKSRAKN